MGGERTRFDGAGAEKAGERLGWQVCRSGSDCMEADVDASGRAELHSMAVLLLEKRLWLVADGKSRKLQATAETIGSRVVGPLPRPCSTFIHIQLHAFHMQNKL